MAQRAKTANTPPAAAATSAAPARTLPAPLFPPSIGLLDPVAAPCAPVFVAEAMSLRMPPPMAEETDEAGEKPEMPREEAPAPVPVALEEAVRDAAEETASRALAQ